MDFVGEKTRMERPTTANDDAKVAHRYRERHAEWLPAT